MKKVMQETVTLALVLALTAVFVCMPCYSASASSDPLQDAFHDEYFYDYDDACVAWGPKMLDVLHSTSLHASVTNWVTTRYTWQLGKTYNLVGFTAKFKCQYIGCSPGVDRMKCKNQPMPMGANQTVGGTDANGKIWSESVVPSSSCIAKNYKARVCQADMVTPCQNTGDCSTTSTSSACVENGQTITAYAQAWIATEHWIDAMHNQDAFPGGCIWPKDSYGATPAP